MGDHKVLGGITPQEGILANDHYGAPGLGVGCRLGHNVLSEHKKEHGPPASSG